MGNARKGQYAFAEFHLDVTDRLLTHRDIALSLPPKCFDLLALLIESAGHLLEKDRIIETLWPDTFVEEANIPNLIGLLRRTLGESPQRPQYIQTVPKRGYRLLQV